MGVALSGGFEASAQGASVSSFTYQGQLQQLGAPFEGMADLTFSLFDAADGGNQIGDSVALTDVSISDGLFTVELGFGTGAFDGTGRWLEIEVGDTLLTPRQSILAAPYALFALDGNEGPQGPPGTDGMDGAPGADGTDGAPGADGMDGAPGADGMDGAPGADGMDGAPGADGMDGAPGDPSAWENVVIVAKSGGDYTSVATALGAITTSSVTNRYLVFVAPGTYTETELCLVAPYVHLKGAGQNVTVITSARSGTVQNSASATVELQDNGRISHCTIANTGSSSPFGIGVWSAGASRAAEISSTTLIADGADGVAHFAIYLSDSEPTIRFSDLSATGANAINAALASVNSAGGFPQPLILDSYLLGGTSVNDSTQTGFGMSLSDTAAEVRNCVIEGGHRAISQTQNGTTRIRNSQVQVGSATNAFLLDTSGSGRVLFFHSGVLYVGNKLATGSTNEPACLFSYNASNAAVNATCD
ncbi:MAG: hypothetical protein L3K26_06485 [Candidatus Hydrogenedentes bacterium]|nr:hypothetical protein [Candidatus Hydrogenedentota bacterium]